MAKFNWGKAALRELDPARVQRTVDFSTPDNMVMKKGRKGKKSAPPSIWAKALTAISKGQKTHKAQVAGKPKQRPVPKAKQVASPLTGQKQHAEAKTRRAARAAHNLAKARKQQAEMEAKKKTHLQAWVDKQDGLTTDRESLHQRWRARLLGRPQQP